MTRTADDKELLAKLRRRTLRVLQDAIGPTERVLLLDTPRHQNCGDSLIWLGELAYLDSLGKRVSYHSDMGRLHLPTVRQLSTNAPILLQGGGNVGDLYPAHDEHRRELIATLPNRKFVLMPQSIWFESRSASEQAKRDYARAADLTVLIREQPSLERASALFPEARVLYCPDAAFGAELNGPMTPRRHPLVLARGDKEYQQDETIEAPHEDWTFARTEQAKWQVNIGLGAGFKRAPEIFRARLIGGSQILNRNCLSLNIRSMQSQFSGRPWIATNRLHAHVLATLLGIPNWVTDNKYGKISAIYEECTKQFSTSNWSNTLSEAIASANDSSLAPS